MDATPSPSLTARELEEVEQGYRSFANADAWPTVIAEPDVWEDVGAELGKLRQQADPAAFNRAVRLAMRFAAVDTGAIEGLYSAERGFTLTVATQAAASDRALSEAGDLARELIEAQLQTYELVLDAATQRTPISETFIRRIHEEITAPQQTYPVTTPTGERQQHELPKGKYKEQPNHVLQQDGQVHAYAPVSSVADEMHRLVGQIRDDRFSQLHPAVQAAYTHHALTAIHPFADGNGRVARALASVFLYRTVGVPLIIPVERAESYLDALAAADVGEYRPFVQLVADAGIEGMELVAERLRTAMAPDPRAQLERLQSLLRAHGGLTHPELDAVAASLARELSQTLSDSRGRLPLPTGVSIQFSQQSNRVLNPPDRYRHAEPKVVISMDGWTPPPASSRVSHHIEVVISRVETDARPFAIYHTEFGVIARYGVRELHPTILPSTAHRLELLAEQIVGRTVAIMADEAGTSLAATAYAPVETRSDSEDAAE